MEKVMVLAPKSAQAYGAAFSIYEFTRDEPALKAMLDRLNAAGVDTSDSVATAKEYYSGQMDQKYQAEYEADAKRTGDMVQQLRPRGGVTAAVAIDNQVDQLVNRAARGQTLDCDLAIKLAIEADQLAPSSSTGRVVQAAYLQRAIQDVSKADPEFAAFAKQYSRALGSSYVIAWAISEPSAYQALVQKNADVLKVVDLIKDDLRRYPRASAPTDWAMLRGIAPQEAAKIESNARAQPRRLIENTIFGILFPASATQALDSYWLLRMLGKPDDEAQCGNQEDGGAGCARADAIVRVPPSTV